MIKEMWNEIVQLLRTQNLEKIDVSIDVSSGVIKLANSIYELEIIINQKWIGYDFKIRKHILGWMVGRSVDTDLYPLDTNVTITREIYDDVHFFLKSLLADKLYYGLKDGKAVFATPNRDGSYRVTSTPRRRFFKTISAENWPAAKVKTDHNLKVLKANSK